MILKLNDEKRKQNYTIHGRDYKKKLDPNLHINPIVDASARPSDVRRIMI